MSAKIIKINTLVSLDTDVYAFKRRADLLFQAAEMKLERKLSEERRTFYIIIYNSLNDILKLPYLISEKKFPESHYNWTGPVNFGPEYFNTKLKEIDNRFKLLHTRAQDFNQEVEKDISLISTLNKDITWEDWLLELEETEYFLNDVKEVFIN